MSRVVFARDLGWALSVALVFGMAGLLMLLSLTILRFRAERRRDRAARIEPAVRQAVSAVLSDGDRQGELRRYFREYPPETEKCLRDLLLVLKGQSKRRLLEAAQAVGLPDRWERIYEEGASAERAGIVRCLASAAGETASVFLARALADPDEGVRVEAARTLAQIGEGNAAERVYEFSRERSLLIKAILAEDLRPHLAILERGIVAADLASGDASRLGHALQMLRAWSTPLSVCLDPVLVHPDRGLRLEALRLVNPIHTSGNTLDAVRLNLQGEPEDIVEAAALAAGRLRLAALAPELVRLLSDRKSAVCRAAARALSAMDHVAPLEEKIRLGGSPGAEAAVEAVQMAHTHRGESGG